MSRKSKYSYEQKIAIVLRCLKGKTSAADEADQLGVSPKSIREWLSSYRSLGESGLMPTSKNVSYSIALKQNAVFL